MSCILDNNEIWHSVKIVKSEIQKSHNIFKSLI